MALMIIKYLFIHFMADFVCQKRDDAINKSHSILHLTNHIVNYGLVFCLCTFLILYTEYDLFHHNPYSLPFYSINILSHFLIDYITSKITSYFYKQQKTSYFWWSIGFDQFLHTSILIWSIDKFIFMH